MCSTLSGQGALKGGVLASQERLYPPMCQALCKGLGVERCLKCTTLLTGTPPFCWEGGCFPLPGSKLLFPVGLMNIPSASLSTGPGMLM